MLGRLLYPVLLGAVAGLALTQSTAALRIEKITRVSQEVYVRQESGRLSGNTVIVSHKGAKRAAPEGRDTQGSSRRDKPNIPAIRRTHPLKAATPQPSKGEQSSVAPSPAERHGRV